MVKCHTFDTLSSLSKEEYIWIRRLEGKSKMCFIIRGLRLESMCHRSPLLDFLIPDGLPWQPGDWKMIPPLMPPSNLAENTSLCMMYSDGIVVYLSGIWDGFRNSDEKLMPAYCHFHWLADKPFSTLIIGKPYHMLLKTIKMMWHIYYDYLCFISQDNEP